MTKFILAIAVALLALGCQPQTTLRPVSEISPSAATEGSLANAKLISDTTEAIRMLQAKSAADFDSRILKFVIQTPVGRPGARAWRELWILVSDGKRQSYIITFRENGLESADFEIQ